MQQIFISAKVVGIQEAYCTNLFSSKDAIFHKPAIRLLKLKDDINKEWQAALASAKKGVRMIVPWDRYNQYVSNIIAHYDDILALKPSEFDNWHRTYFNMLTDAELKFKLNIAGSVKSFYEWVVWAMRYDAVRAGEYAPYIRKLGIKACVYCNAAYAVPTHGKGKNNEDVTTYEIDHFKPKSKYPFLCTTFFNLVPSCGPCNRRKNDSEVKFCLYTEGLPIYPLFRFDLDIASVGKYLISHKKEHITYTFASMDVDLLESHRTFHIQDVYDEHKDIAEEVIWKHFKYNANYRKMLNEHFGPMFRLTDDEMYRMIFATYPPSESIHRRPLSLFIRDIVEQMNKNYPSTF